MRLASRVQIVQLRDFEPVPVDIDHQISARLDLVYAVTYAAHYEVARPTVGLHSPIDCAELALGLDNAVYLRHEVALLQRLLYKLARVTGFRPATPDKLPLIGAWPAVQGLWIAAGHEGLGITTALGTGSMLTDLILGKTPGIDTAPFAPGRAMAGAH